MSPISTEPVRVCGHCYRPLPPNVKLFCDAACEASWAKRL